ncbi:MAG: AAA family ATPase, partial [Proteobacteria bacterium]|nr:AAA family ATPase [Pseudomonadota bacterium]
QQKHLVIPACRLCLPPELEREFTVVEFPLPGPAALRPVLDNILLSAGLDTLTDEAAEAVLAAASGLTTMEAENAFALSVVEAGSVQPALVAREKAQAVKKTGLLEVIEAKESLADIGGLDQLKEWLLQRRPAFSQRARDYGLPVPKGVLIVGLPGTGKSLTAKATAQSLGVPLLKLDAGRIFAGLVGQSESNLRSVIQTAEAIAPCVLWCEELEKAFSGTKSSGSTDGGTTARVFGAFLTWLQEKTKAVFVVATANDVTQLPPELLRKGRFDELWFVDLPNDRERESIWQLVITRHGRDPEQFDLTQLARITDGYTGSEIEAAFTEALFLAFAQEREPSDLDIAKVLTEFVPLSKQMAEQINGLRQWAKGRARPATSPVAPERRLRKLAA